MGTYEVKAVLIVGPWRLERIAARERPFDCVLRGCFRGGRGECTVGCGCALARLLGGKLFAAAITSCAASPAAEQSSPACSCTASAYWYVRKTARCVTRSAAYTCLFARSVDTTWDLRLRSFATARSLAMRNSKSASQDSRSEVCARSTRGADTPRWHARQHTVKDTLVCGARLSRQACLLHVTKLVPCACDFATQPLVVSVGFCQSYHQLRILRLACNHGCTHLRRELSPALPTLGQPGCTPTARLFLVRVCHIYCCAAPTALTWRGSAVLTF